MSGQESTSPQGIASSPLATSAKPTDIHSLADKLSELADQCAHGKMPFGANFWPPHAAYEHAAHMARKLAESIDDAAVASRTTAKKDVSC